MNRAAWVAWLEHGSKEDWAERVGVLELPTVVVAGEKDRSLGPDQQRELTMPHFSQAELRTPSRNAPTWFPWKSRRRWKPFCGSSSPGLQPVAQLCPQSIRISSRRTASRPDKCGARRTHRRPCPDGPPDRADKCTSCACCALASSRSRQATRSIWPRRLQPRNSPPARAMAGVTPRFRKTSKPTARTRRPRRPRLRAHER